jgi:formate dehydrogenase major subunit
MASLSSRVGTTTLRVQVSERMPQGVVYTTFHHPESGANVVTTEISDWATSCPEYKVTAVQVSKSNQPSDWQRDWEVRERDHKVVGVTPAIAAE